MKKYYCIECKKELVNYTSLRCKGCNDKKVSGKGSPNYKHGDKSKCTDCGKEVNYRYKRCHSCACKYLWTQEEFRDKNPHDGVHNSMYGKKHTQETKSKISIKAGGNGIPGDYGEYGFEFNDTLKEQIRKRDNYQCQNCEITEEEHIIVFGFKLSIHHIDYDKNNSSESNLVSLCNCCHTRTNFSRNYWKECLKENLSAKF